MVTVLDGAATEREAIGFGRVHRWAANGLASSMAAARETMSWDDLGIGTRDLARMIADDGYDPDMILSIARGGLLVGAALGYALSVKNVYTMNVEYYVGVDERLEVPRILPPAPDFVDLQDARILIADDVADTGHTLESVQRFCEGKVAEVRTAVLYEKPQSAVLCDYVWKRTDRWINFPWSSKPPVVVRDHAVRDA
jgi:hypoxanthine phosphoribosyltransferase